MVPKATGEPVPNARTLKNTDVVPDNDNLCAGTGNDIVVAVANPFIWVINDESGSVADVVFIHPINSVVVVADTAPFAQTSQSPAVREMLVIS
jgi:hypothetical protein